MTPTGSGSRIDLNADVGESFGARRAGDEEPLFDAVTSANVACGVHAGSPAVIAATIEAALRHGVCVGAHPSYPDPEGFGRRTMALPAFELRNSLIYQMGAVAAIARALGTSLTHVKPHGALYNDAARDDAIAKTIAGAVSAFDPALVLVGLAGSRSLSVARAAGLDVAAEAFCDRRYEPNGRLRERTHADALIAEPQEAVEQALDVAVHRRVRSVTGTHVAVDAQTLCIHGDGPHAVEIARAVRAALETAGVAVRALRC